MSILSLCLSVCRSVCLSTCITCKPCIWTSPNCLSMLPVAVAQSSSDSVAIRYVLQVLWMMSCFHTMGPTLLCSSLAPVDVAASLARATAAHWFTGSVQSTAGLLERVGWAGRLLSHDWTWLLPGRWCTFRHVLHASIELHTGMKSAICDCLVWYCHAHRLFWQQFLMWNWVSRCAKPLPEISQWLGHDYCRLPVWLLALS